MKTVAIITAAGYGKRMGKPKQFIEIGGKPILEWTLSVFEKTKIVDEMILVVNEGDIERAKKFKFSKLKQVIAGGEERQDSVFNGLKAVPGEVEIVAIHDGARPFIIPEIIEKAVAEAQEFGAVVVGIPVNDTIKSVNHQKLTVINTLNREELWAAQTPQVFKKEIILQAYKNGKEKHCVTDDAMLIEKLGIPVKMVMGSSQNIKLTKPEDLKIAEGILRKGEKG
ncbi:MAG: 2-C-methyl-D-erythritol 4-phosphate cytidylyltransferase [Candidatus Margulisiibacteriota bacterium]